MNIDLLVNSKNKAISYFAKQDLLKEKVNIKELWTLPEVLRILNRQLKNGSWKYPSKAKLMNDPDQVETFRQLGELISKYGLDREHEGLKRACEYMFTKQTSEGDFRGILGNQYAPYYSGAIMELLIKAGYANDSRIKKAFDWLLSIRQNDLCWALPFRTRKMNLTKGVHNKTVIQPDRTKPSSHLITGMVLRAFAIHPEYKNSKEAIIAGEFITNRMFKKDPYPDRNTPSFWTSFSYPYWFTDLLTSLDSLSLMGFDKKDNRIIKAIDWFNKHELKNGLFNVHIVRGSDPYSKEWTSLAIHRVLKRLKAD